MRVGSIRVERKDVARLWDYSRRVSWPDVLANRRAEARNPGLKIFVIGPNRCATTSLHKFFHFNGLRSLHCRIGEMYLAREIRDRRGDDAALRAFLGRWTVYSDFVYLTETEHYEAHGLYETYARLFPEAVFILNDRDTEGWIASRLRFKDDFLPRYLAVHGGTAEQAAARWRAEQDAHRAAALAFFAGHTRFVHLRIDQTGPQDLAGAGVIEPVRRLLSPPFRLDPRHWRPFNAEARHAHG